MANRGFHGLRFGICIHFDPPLCLLEHNSPRAESNHTHEEKAHRGTASSYLEAHHGQETRNREGRHRAEHRR